jgi:hypothetical protein
VVDLARRDLGRNLIEESKLTTLIYGHAKRNKKVFEVVCSK